MPAKKASTKKPTPTPKPDKDLRGAQVTQADLSRLLGMDRHTIADRLDGVESTSKRAKLDCYPLGDALEAIIAGQSTTLSAAKLRKEEADASMRELKLARERGLLIEVRDVRDKQQKVFTKMFQRFAVQLPGEIKGQLFKCDTPAQVAETLKHSVTKIFNDIRNDPTIIF